MDTLAENARSLVRDWAPISPAEQASSASFATHFLGTASPMWRESGPDHATASGLVLDPTLSRALLVYHRKGRFWVQPGGHIEPADVLLADAARREVREETGLRLGPALAYDLDHHALSASFGRCASHLDFGFAFLADPSEVLTISDESEDLRWWHVDALPSELATGVERRLLAARRRLSTIEASAPEA